MRLRLTILNFISYDEPLRAELLSRRTKNPYHEVPDSSSNQTRQEDRV